MTNTTGTRRSPPAEVAKKPSRTLIFFTMESHGNMPYGNNGDLPRPEDQTTALNQITSCEISMVTEGEKPEHHSFIGDRAEQDGLTFLLERLNEQNDQAPPPQLITYGGRNNLMPRLYVAAMIYGLHLGIVSATSNRQASYQTRFNPYYHFDIADLISHYGASRAPALTTLVSAINGGNKEEMTDMECLMFLHKKHSETI